MVWLKIAANVAQQHKFIDAGPVACWLWLAGLGYCKLNLTDGLIRKDIVPVLVPTLKGAYRHAAKLVEVNLWQDTVGGYLVKDYLEWNPSKEEVETKRRDDVDRKRRVRVDSTPNPEGRGVDSARLARAPADSVSVSDSDSAGGSDAGKADPRIVALRRIVEALPDHARIDAPTFHRWIEQKLKSEGLSVQREFPIQDRGDGHSGFIDLVVQGDPPIAIELDWRTQRGRSISKLLAFDGLRVVVLREAHEVTQRVPGVEVICCQELPPEVSGRQRTESVIAPHWAPTPSRRDSPLVGRHHGCFSLTPAACARGICVPNWLGQQWRQQYGDELGQADHDIRQVVEAAIAALPAHGPIGDEPKKFWQAVWQAAHGSHAPHASGGRGQLTLDAAKRVALARLQRSGRAS